MISHLRSIFHQLHSLNYPSLRDNNTLRKFLVPEVLCFADKLKQKWIKQRSAESDGSRREVGGAKACQQASGKGVKARRNNTC